MLLQNEVQVYIDADATRCFDKHANIRSTGTSNVLRHQF